MFSYLEIMIAWRYLLAKKKEGLLSLIVVLSFLGISLGVAALIVVMAVMSGFRTELTGKILGFSGHITVSAYEKQGILGYDPLAKIIIKEPGVKRAIPVINGQVMVSSKWGNLGSLVKGIHPEDLKTTPLIANNIKYGSLDGFLGKDAIVMGSRLADRLGVVPGQKVTLISPVVTHTAIGSIPRIKTYDLVATFESGMYEFDVSTVYMTLEAAQILMRYKDTAEMIEVTTEDPDNVEEISRNLVKLTKGLYLIQNWKMNNMSLVNALKIEQVVMFFILTIIIIVAAFNIVSSLIMLVNDKSFDIAILRTIGLNRSSIMRIFFICGSFIGVVGTSVGILLGSAIAYNIENIQSSLSNLIGFPLFDPVIYYLTKLPADVQNIHIVLVSVMSLAISFIATIYPAWKAAKLNPVEALRYE